MIFSKEHIIAAHQKGQIKTAKHFASKFNSLFGGVDISDDFGKADAEKYFEDTFNRKPKKSEKASPTFWITSPIYGKKAGYQSLERAVEMITMFEEIFPSDIFYIEREMPVDGLVIAASYIGTNNKNNEPVPFKGWVGDYIAKRMTAIYGDKNNLIEVG